MKRCVLGGPDAAAVMSGRRGGEVGRVVGSGGTDGGGGDFSRVFFA